MRFVIHWAAYETKSLFSLVWPQLNTFWWSLGGTLKSLLAIKGGAKRKREKIFNHKIGFLKLKVYRLQKCSIGMAASEYQTLEQIRPKKKCMYNVLFIHCLVVYIAANKLPLDVALPPIWHLHIVSDPLMCT